MRHIEKLLTMRRCGGRPAHVRITDQREAPGEAWWQHAELRPYAELQVERADSPAVADLRCLVGLPVLIDVLEPEGCLRWAQAAKDAGASPVIALHPTPELV